MPIRQRQPATSDPLMAQRVEGLRLGGAEDGISTSPALLLSPRTPTYPAPVPAPARALALDALRLARLLRDPSRRPPRWAQPGFAEEVEQIRRHLAPVRTRRTLASSYGREAFHLAPPRGDDADAAPIRLAYALRWLELRDGATGPSWQALLS
jgi:hypothetical protein